ncbi:MAG TPA: tetratricopeptide repeat protein [Candidatus Dormibacteraeota bacterium]|nr:tetratricopeptide repeat protein [Candidatus Dormibacteraeota bacterium]
MRSTSHRGRRPGVDVEAAAIRRARQQAGLSQSQLGGTHLTRQAVHLIETGKVRPSIQSLSLIAGRLGLPMTAFLLDDERAEHLPARRLAELERLCMQRQYATALALADEVLAAAVPDQVAALAHHWAGVALYHLTRAREAARRLQEAERLADRLPDPWLAADSMGWRAAALNRLDDGSALEVGFQALSRYRALEPRRPEVEARMLEHMGTFWGRRQGYDQAEACYRESLRVMGPVRDLERMASVYHGLAGCSRAIGDLDAAAALMRKALAFYVVEHELRPDGSRDMLVRGENDYGDILMQQGRLDLAEELIETALGRLDAEAEGYMRAGVLHSLGEVRMRQGRHEEALTILAEAVDLATSSDQPIPLAEAHQLLGELYEALGEREQADASYSAALAVLEAAELTERALDCQRAWRRLVARRTANEPAPSV